MVLTSMVPAVLRAGFSLPQGSESSVGEVVIELADPTITNDVLQERILDQVVIQNHALRPTIVRESHIRKKRGKRLVVQVPKGQESGVVESLMKRPGVLRASENIMLHTTQLADDTSFALKDDLYNTGSNTGRTNEKKDADIDAELAWTVTKGSGAIIAIVDSGVDIDHVDLDDNIWTNDDPAGGGDDDGNGFIDDTHGWDFVAFNYPNSGGKTARDVDDANLTPDNDPNPEPNSDDEDGDGSADDGSVHGTHVAGIAAAEVNNDLGVVGVAPEATIMPLRALDDEGNGVLSQIQDAMDYAINNGADVINLSLSTDGGPTGSGYSSAFDSTIEDAWSSGVTIIAAAGNANKNLVTYPESPVGNDCGLSCATGSNKVIGVASVNNQDTRSSFSNYATSGTSVDISAPGGELTSGRLIYSTLFRNDAFACCTADYGNLAGTSMATPQVTGVVALLRAADPAMTVSTIRSKLRDRSDPNTSSHIGVGRLNASHALIGDDIVRFDGSDIYNRAVRVARARYPEKGSADSAVIVSGVSYPFSVPGPSLAESTDGILVLTNGSALTSDTLAVIDHALDDDTKPVYLIGDSTIISSSVVSQLTDAGYSNVQRLTGGDRIDAALAVASTIAPSTIDEVIIVHKDNYGDALSATAVAGKRNIPILINQTGWLDNRNRDWMLAHDVQRAYIVAGTGIIKDIVADLIEDQGIDARRIAGRDRYETSMKVAKCFFSTTTSSSCSGVVPSRSNAGMASLISSESFSDAVIGGGYMGFYGSPVLLGTTNALSSYVTSYMDGQSNIFDGFIFGSASQISSNTRKTFYKLIESTQ